MNRKLNLSSTQLTFLLLLAWILASCDTIQGTSPAQPTAVSESVPIVPTEIAPTPAATPNAEIEAATQVALKSFWQAMEMKAYGPASALFMDVYRGARQWVQPDELALLYNRAPDLFSAEPTFTILNSSIPKPMVYLGGDLVLSHGTMELNGNTIPLVVEVHRLDGNVRLSRLHVADARLYSLPRSLAAGEYQAIERKPLDRSKPTSPMLLVESSVFLERIRGVLFFDGMPVDTFVCQDSSYTPATVVDVLGWHNITTIEDYAAGLDANDLVEQMRLKGVFTPEGRAAEVRFFEAFVGVSDEGWCLQKILVDHNPSWALRGFFAAYGGALWVGDSAEIQTFWCDGFKEQAESGNGQQVQFAFEPTEVINGVIQVNGTRSDVGLFSAGMQFTDNKWCFNSLTITDPSN
ncbi:MAG: hypothetical protein ACPG8W_05490 [Candidatus Promineifilaceae bacterium]